MYIKSIINADLRNISYIILIVDSVSGICFLYGSYASSLIFNLCHAARSGMKYSTSYLTGHRTSEVF